MVSRKAMTEAHSERQKQKRQKDRKTESKSGVVMKRSKQIRADQSERAQRRVGWKNSEP